MYGREQQTCCDTFCRNVSFDWENGTQGASAGTHNKLAIVAPTFTDSTKRTNRGGRNITLTNSESQIGRVRARHKRGPWGIQLLRQHRQDSSDPHELAMYKIQYWSSSMLSTINKLINSIKYT